MPSSIPQISQSNSRCIAGQQAGYLRSMLRRPLYLIGAAMLTLVSILAPCATSLAQALQADPKTIAASFQRQDVPQVTATSISSSQDAIRKTLSRQTLHFEPNSRGDMSSRTLGRELLIGSGGKVQFGEQGKPVVSIVLKGADPGAEPKGLDLLPGRSNYILGKDPAKWRTHVSQFDRVQVPGVYPGIDLAYYGNGEQLEHDYLVAPNADPAQIRMQFRGATPHLDAETGELVLQQPEGFEAAIRLEKPVAYQVSEDGTRRVVAANYRLHADGQAQFTLGNYDHARPLVIDPVILYGTYFGGNQNDSIVDLKLGSDGSIFLLITGDSTDLKTVAAPAGICNGTCGPANPDNGDVKPDMYVAKLDSTGQKLLFATYLGGSDDDEALSLALDTDGSVYVAGFSHSQDFPLINNYPGGGPAVGGNSAGTLSKLSADGSTLLYSTFIGFGNPDIDFLGQVGNATAPVMVTANNGIVYLIGVATIDQTGADFIWKTNPLFTTGNDFLAKFDTTKSGTASIVYATQVGDSIGGLYSAQLSSLALDSKGDVWLYGQTSNTAFPATTTGALQPQCKSTPCSASFLMEIDPTGTSVPYATYLGGSTANGTVTPRDIVIDPSDNIYVSGSTTQTDFPIVNGAITNISNGIGYASKLSSDGKTLLYSTFVQGIEIAVSSRGQLAFTGTYGPGLMLRNNLPTTPPPSTGTDAIFGLLDTTQSGANSLLISSYLGTNTSYTTSHRVLIASTGQILVAGETSATDLPVVNAYQTTCASCASRTGADGFIAAIQPNDTLTLTPATVAFPSTSVGSTSAAMTATLYNGTTKSVYLAQPTLTDSTDFTQSDNCSGILSPLASCTVTFTFKPQSSGTLTSTYSTGDLDNPSNPLTIALTGTGIVSAISVSPMTLAFGSLADGSTATMSVTLTNAGSSVVPISGAVVSGSGFSLTGNGCGANIAAGSSCQYSVTFSPTTVGPYTGTLNIAESFGSQVVQLTATGTQAKGSETLLPATVNFGNVYDNTTATKTVTFTNNGPGAVTFSAANITGQVFHIVTTTCTTQPVAAGSSCTYTLSYIPYAVGSDQGTFTVVDGSSNPSVALTGTGIQAPTTDDVRLSPGSLNFPDVVVGASQTSPYASLTFANQTSQTIQAQGKHYGIAGSGAAPFGQDIGISGFCQLPANGDNTITLAPYTSCVIGIFFNATDAVADTTYNAQFDINWNYVGDTQLHYMATALTANTLSLANAVVTPTSIQFPATPNGKTSVAQIVSVTNTGDQPLGFGGATFNGTNPNAFTQNNNCPASLNKNGTCQIAVSFTPLATGNGFTANLKVSLSTGDINVLLNGGTSPSDFVLSSPAPLQQNPSPKWVIDVSPLTASIGFNEPITFKVTGLDASYGTPVFTPSTLTPNGATVSTTLTLTQAPSAAFNQPPGGAGAALPALALCIVFFSRRKLKNYRCRIVPIVVLIALTAMSLTGCTVTPPVPFTVTATSGTINHDLPLTLQP